MEKILVTGMAGFIGFHTAKKLVKEGYHVVGIDNLNPYYDRTLKIARLKALGIEYSDEEGQSVWHSENQLVSFYPLDLTDHKGILSLFQQEQFDRVVHLAAQAGVRYSLTNPKAYTDSNVSGFLSILEGARATSPKHLVFASSSSVYGLNTKFPFDEDIHTDHPMSLYAATKRANEMMAHSYAHLYQLPSTGLRFFTAYGPWGRPDMALFIFVKKILEGDTIEVYNKGQMLRDFTFIDDLVEGIYLTMKNSPVRNADFDHEDPIPSRSSAPYRILNIGNNNPVVLIDFVREIEKALGKRAKIEFKPLQPGDVTKTYANVERLQTLTGYKPNTPITKGVKQFVDWYLDYFHNT